MNRDVLGTIGKDFYPLLFFCFMTIEFKQRTSVEQVEEGCDLAPKFDDAGLIPAITTDYTSGELLMLGYMNEEALKRTIETGEAHYFSRSRQAIWRKGETSGLTQKIEEMRIDDDQDAVWLRVAVGGNGASCHVGYRSCFYRAVPIGTVGNQETQLEFVETEKMFDEKQVYAGMPNPTKL